MEYEDFRLKKKKCSSMQLVFFTGPTPATGFTFADYVLSHIDIVVIIITNN